MECRQLVLATLVLAAASCGGGGSTPTTPTTTTTPVVLTPPAVTSYLNEVVDRLQANWYRRSTIDWASVRAKVHAGAAGAANINAARFGIQLAFDAMADAHSHLEDKDGAILGTGRGPRSCNVGTVPDASVPADVGYVRVGTAALPNLEANLTAFADGVLAQIRSSDRDGLAGWIVDLRGNGGGNMWPMLAGLSPILGDGIVGYYSLPDGSESTSWRLQGAGFYQGDALKAHGSAPYALRQPSPRVAVLVDGAVASSGEATFIAFRGRANTRSFGGGTCGYATGVSVLPMSFESWLFLSTVAMADRTRATYGNGAQVMPDEVIADTRNQTVTRAIQWLRTGS